MDSASKWLVGLGSFAMLVSVGMVFLIVYVEPHPIDPRLFAMPAAGLFCGGSIIAYNFYLLSKRKKAKLRV